MKTKVQKLAELVEEIATLQVDMESDEAKNTDDNRQIFDAKHAEAMSLKKSIQQDFELTGMKTFLEAPANDPKSQPAGGDGAFSQPFDGVKSLGDQIIEKYKDGGSQIGVSQAFEAKGFVTSSGLSSRPQGTKATFDSAATGLDTSRNYVTPPGGLVLIEQQRLTVRDLLSSGETTQNTIYYPKEDVYVNGAQMTGEEGEKPEATLDIGSGSAPVKKIAVLIKVSDEMWDDFPMLRDYINQRLRFMVEQREEDQLLNGNGAGNNILGILNSGVLTQAKGGDTNLDAIHKAITKVRTPASNVGGYEPDGLIIHPTDWQLIRLAKDANNQYFGGGPFFGEYGVGQYVLFPPVWGLRPVVTTAIAAGTALVGAFKLGAQIFQRTGIDVKTFDQNEDDVNFNRKTIRVEERLALAVFRPTAFCTVTGIV